ncbi:uncharacterized protein LOC125532646 [Triticum urartu]|uniref:uncharacterized protein LOC125532646 n=1 Tax=Triticum urartu TaxID=4572 RepID=UPI0020447BE6|nr:uncharacterized protein LOC125532646 [Triticum urartu]
MGGRWERMDGTAAHAHGGSRGGSGCPTAAPAAGASGGGGVAAAKLRRGCSGGRGGSRRAAAGEEEEAVRLGRLPATRGRFPWLRRREEAVKGATAGGERRGCGRRRSCGRRRRSCEWAVSFLFYCRTLIDCGLFRG